MDHNHIRRRTYENMKRSGHGGPYSQYASLQIKLHYADPVTRRIPPFFHALAA